MKKNNVKSLLLLNVLFILYSFAGVFSKLASTNVFFSWPFMFYYGLTLVILVIYALVWQQILKSLPLTVMFANKSIVMIFGMLWGALIFNEQLRWGMLVGIPMVFLGIWLVVMEND